jgi:hypothetical protein
MIFINLLVFETFCLRPFLKNRMHKVLPGELGPPHRGIMVLIRSNYETPLSKARSEHGTIEAFYGYNVEAKKFCVSFEGCDEYTWLKHSEFHGINPKWLEICKKHGKPKHSPDSNGKTCFRALYLM